MTIYKLDAHIPEIHPSAYVAKEASVIGKVRLGKTPVSGAAPYCVATMNLS